MITTRQYLKQLEKPTLRKLFKLANFFVEERMRDNTCMKLNIGKTKYHSMLNEALIKIEYTINQLDKIRTF